MRLTKRDAVLIEDYPLDNFETEQAFFERLATIAKSRGDLPGMSLTLNVHSANLGHERPEYKALLKDADILRCDGVGVMMACAILGRPIVKRMTNADYFPQLLEYLADQGVKVYLVAGKPGMLERAMKTLETQVSRHSIIGIHHGYLVKDPVANQHVIDEINRLQPDLVIVGMGMPVQEFWIGQNRAKMNVGAFFAVGAMFEYYAGEQYRCGPLMRKLGLEWLTRLARYPQRMFGRYVVGNPAFLSRIARQAFQEKVEAVLRPSRRTRPTT